MPRILGNVPAMLPAVGTDPDTLYGLDTIAEATPVSPTAAAAAPGVRASSVDVDAARETASTRGGGSAAAPSRATAAVPVLEPAFEGVGTDTPAGELRKTDSRRALEEAAHHVDPADRLDFNTTELGFRKPVSMHVVCVFSVRECTCVCSVGVCTLCGGGGQVVVVVVVAIDRRARRWLWATRACGSCRCAPAYVLPACAPFELWISDCARAAAARPATNVEEGGSVQASAAGAAVASARRHPT